MCNNGGNWWWIIILILLFSGCGCNLGMNNNCCPGNWNGCENNNNNCCC